MVFDPLFLLFRTCVDGSDAIMNDPDAMGDDDIPLRDNMTESPLLEDRTSSQRNRALVAVVALSMLCYAQSERSNNV